MLCGVEVVRLGGIVRSCAGSWWFCRLDTDFDMIVSKHICQIWAMSVQEHDLAWPEKYQITF